MTIWVRLWEKLTGAPHRRDEARKVRIAALELTSEVRGLEKQLNKYMRSRDPFAAMMADMYNRGQLTRISKGPP